MQFKCIFYAVVTTLTFVGCGTNKNAEESKTSQLINQIGSFKCVVDDTRAATLRSKYQSFVRGNDEAWQQRAFQTLALVPDEYLKVIFEDYKAPISLWNSGGGLTTQTVRGGQPPDRPFRSEKISISRGQPHYFGLLHEIGHAIQPELDRTHKSFFNSFRYWYQQAARVSTPESQHMWSYPKTATSEYWAEVFDSYYCSPESRDHMRATFPRSYQFAKRYLIDPTNVQAPSTTTSAYQIENDRAGDEDSDGISNQEDKCSATDPDKRAQVRQDAEFLGCAPGEFRDGIIGFMN